MERRARERQRKQEKGRQKARGETNGRLVDPSIRVVSGSANRHGRPPPGLVPFIDQAPAGLGRLMREDREMLVDPLSLRARPVPPLSVPPPSPRPPFSPLANVVCKRRSTERATIGQLSTRHLEPGACAPFEAADLSLEDSLEDHVPGRKLAKDKGSGIESIGYRLSCTRNEIGFRYRAEFLRISSVQNCPLVGIIKRFHSGITRGASDYLYE